MSIGSGCLRHPAGMSTCQKFILRERVDQGMPFHSSVPAREAYWAHRENCFVSGQASWWDQFWLRLPGKVGYRIVHRTPIVWRDIATYSYSRAWSVPPLWKTKREHRDGTSHCEPQAIMCMLQDGGLSLHAFMQPHCPLHCGPSKHIADLASILQLTS